MIGSPGAAVCRICMAGECSNPYLGKQNMGEPLISPCYCKGTVGLIHRSCLELWFSFSTHPDDNKPRYCDICKYRFNTLIVPPNFFDYIKKRGWNSLGKTGQKRRRGRGFLMDGICLFIFSSLLVGALWITWFSNYFDNAILTDKEIEEQVIKRTSRSVWLILFAMIISLMLSVLFLVWFVLVVRSHSREYLTWRENHKTFVLHGRYCQYYLRRTNDPNYFPQSKTAFQRLSYRVQDFLYSDPCKRRCFPSDVPEDKTEHARSEIATTEFEGLELLHGSEYVLLNETYHFSPRNSGSGPTVTGASGVLFEELPPTVADLQESSHSAVEGDNRSPDPGLATCKPEAWTEVSLDDTREGQNDHHPSINLNILYSS